MKYLIMLEGKCEEALIETVMHNEDFRIDRDDMLDERPHIARRWVASFEPLIQQLPQDEKIEVLRIGDTLKDSIKIPSTLLKQRIFTVRKYCTKPELEILLIIEEGLFDDFSRGSVKKPKVYAKINIQHKGLKYDATPQWLREYFSEHDPKGMIQAYSQIKRHNKSERYLSELLTD